MSVNHNSDDDANVAMFELRIIQKDDEHLIKTKLQFISFISQ